MSNKCQGCGLNVAKNMTHCPICGKYITDEKDMNCSTAYDLVDHKKLIKPWLISTLRRSIWIAAFLALGLNLFFMWDDFRINFWWSFYVVASAILLDIGLFMPLIRKQYFWKEVFAQLLALLGYALFIDWYTDLSVSWSLSFIYPITLSVFSLGSALMVVILRKADPGNSLLVMLIVLLLNVGLFLFGVLLLPYLLGDKYLLLPTLIALAITFTVFVFFATFRFKDFVKTMFKKFHI